MIWSCSGTQSTSALIAVPGSGLAGTPLPPPSLLTLGGGEREETTFIGEWMEIPDFETRDGQTHCGQSFGHELQRCASREMASVCGCILTRSPALLRTLPMSPCLEHLHASSRHDERWQPFANISNLDFSRAVTPGGRQISPSLSFVYELAFKLSGASLCRPNPANGISIARESLDQAGGALIRRWTESFLTSRRNLTYLPMLATFGPMKRCSRLVLRLWLWDWNL
jgi:hypothetical protein